MTARRRSVCDEEWVRKRRHLVRQVLSKHLSLALRQREMASGGRGGVFGARRGQECGGGAGGLLVHVAEVADRLVLHDAQVVHGAAEGNLDGLADARRAPFHHFDLVDGLVQAQRHHLGSRKPLPEGETVGIG